MSVGSQPGERLGEPRRSAGPEKSGRFLRSTGRGPQGPSTRQGLLAGKARARRWGAKATAQDGSLEWTVPVGTPEWTARVQAPDGGPAVSGSRWRSQGGLSRVGILEWVVPGVPYRVGAPGLQAPNGGPGARPPGASPGWPAGARGNKAAGGQRRTWALSWGWSRPPPRWRTGSWAPAC